MREKNVCRRGETFMSLIACVLRRIWMWKRGKEIFFSSGVENISQTFMYTRKVETSLEKSDGRGNSKDFSFRFLVVTISIDGCKWKWKLRKDILVTSVCIVIVYFYISLGNPSTHATKFFPLDPRAQYKKEKVEIGHEESHKKGYTFQF